jgi:hypothetical protein
LISILPDVVLQGGLAVQHDMKLGTMKLIMLYRQGLPNGYNILILILVQEWPEKATRSHEEPQVALFAHGAPQQPMRGHGEP